MKMLTLGLLAMGLTTTFSVAEQIPLAGQTLFPESLAIDKSGGIYVSSVLDAKIIYVSPNHVSQEFIARGEHGLISVGGLKLSNDGSKLYACNSDLGMNEFRGTSAPALLAFDVSDKSLAGRWELPNGGLCNDIAISENGTVYITDSFVPRILQLSPDADELSLLIMDERFVGEGFNLSGIIHVNGGLYIAKFNTSELFFVALDAAGNANKPVLLELTQPLMAPDGLAKLDDDTFLIAESSGQLSKVSISESKATVEVLATDLRAPTSVETYGKNAYVVMGQLDRLPIPGGSAPSPEPFRIEIFDVGK